MLLESRLKSKERLKLLPLLLPKHRELLLLSVVPLPKLLRNSRSNRQPKLNLRLLRMPKSKKRRERPKKRLPRRRERLMRLRSPQRSRLRRRLKLLDLQPLMLRRRLTLTKKLLRLRLEELLKKRRRTDLLKRRLPTINWLLKRLNNSQRVSLSSKLPKKLLKKLPRLLRPPRRRDRESRTRRKPLRSKQLSMSREPRWPRRRLRKPQQK
jgi:hypothetical protein